MTGYRIEQRITGADMWSVVIDNTGSGFTTYNVRGLTGGTTYDFQVSAINAAGMGPMSTSWSTTIPTTTTSLVPPAPCTTAPPPTLAVDPTPDPRIPPTPLYVC